MTDFISGKAAIAGGKPGQGELKRELTKTLRIMKLAAILLFAAAMHVSAEGLTQDKITLSLKNAPLEKAFDAIEAQSGFVFIYKDETVRDKKISIQVTNVSLADALTECLKGQALSYRIVGKSVAIKSEKKEADIAAITSEETPPLIDVKGRVLNEKGDPVEGVTVRVKGTEKQTLTDKNGEFSLITVERDAVLVFTHITMESFQLKVSGQTELLINLRTKVSSLGEVTVTVNTGYQQVSKERFVGAVATLDSAAFHRRAGMDIIGRLDGTVTGILFDKKGTGGQLQSIQVRGISTLDLTKSPDKSPLIIVDNFPFKQDLSTINVNDVESISVLKDAAATSIWGAQAGNGVIVINTKKGKYNQSLKLALSSNITVQDKPDQYYYPQMSVSDFVDAEVFLFNKGRYDADLINTSTWPVVSPVVEMLAKRRSGKISAADSIEQIAAYKSMDIRRDLDKYVYRRAIQQQHYLNVSGGSNVFYYSLSAGYNHELNKVQHSKPDDLYTLNMNTGFRPLKGLDVSTGVKFSRSTKRSSDFGLPTPLYPYAQLADAEGKALALPYSKRTAFIDTVGADQLLDWKYRPLDEIRLVDRTDKFTFIQINTTITYRFKSWLNASVSYQYGNQLISNDNFNCVNTFYARDIINQFTNLSQTNPDLRNPLPIGGIMDMFRGEASNQNVRGQINFNKTFAGKHGVTAMVAAENFETKTSGNNSRFYNYNKELGTFKTSMDYITMFPSYANLFGNQRIPNGNSHIPDGVNRTVSFLGNVSYSFNDRYTFYASGRKDGSNVFGVNTNKKWNPLWSVGTSWDVTKEAFFTPSILSALRLRLSYGFTGNPGRGTGSPTITYASNPAMFTSLSQASPNDAPNPDLRWETVRTINEAIDFALLKGRITGSLDVFQKRSKDLIAIFPVAPVTGISNLSVYKNVANMKGQGFEIKLTSKNIQGPFEWQTTFGLSHAKMVVTQLYTERRNASDFIYYSLNAAKGRIAYGLASYKWGGLDPVTGDPQGYFNKNVSKNYSAIASDSVDNQVFHGSSIPLYSGFINNSFSWNGFTLSANITYKLQYYFRKPTINYNLLMTSGEGNADFAKRWQNPGDEQFTNIPSLVYPSNGERDYFFQYSEVNVLRGDHIRLQDLSLQYTLRIKNASKMVFKNMMMFLYANNLNLILWRKNESDLDPDYTGGQTFIIPLPRSLTAGINLSF
jgi:TonB-dependent starch-binding outer membrane protein SusC